MSMFNHILSPCMPSTGLLKKNHIMHYFASNIVSRLRNTNKPDIQPSQSTPMRGRTSLSRDFAPCPARLQCFTFVPPRHVMPAADIRPSASVCYAATLLCCYGATVLHAQLPHRTIRNQNLGWALWDIPRADWKRPLHLSSIGK
jgi:hypothetical protein